MQRQFNKIEEVNEKEATIGITRRWQQESTVIQEKEGVEAPMKSTTKNP